MTGRFKTKHVLQGLLFSGALGLMGWSIASAAPPEVSGPPGSPEAPESGTAPSPSKQATAPPQGEAPAATLLDHNVYARASAVRRKAALTDQDLAALGLNQDQAEAVLERLVDWCGTNGAQLDQARQTLRAAEQAAAELERMVRIGTATARDIQELPGKRAERHSAEAALTNLRDQVAAYAMQAPGTPVSAATAWTQAQSLPGAGVGLSRELRYLPTLDASRLETLRTTADQNGVSLEDALMFDEKQELLQIRQRVQANLPGVAAAVETVMPDPDPDALVDDALLLRD